MVYVLIMHENKIFQVSDAPSAPKSKVGVKTNVAATSDEDKEIEAMLAQLKA